jgi:hypothetical protein
MIMIESEGITEQVREWRTDVVARIVSQLGLEHVMFEAADPDVFTWYIRNYGIDVNLSSSSNACERVSGAPRTPGAGCSATATRRRTRRDERSNCTPCPGRAGPHPHLDILSKEECESHLAGDGVGRFVLLAEQGPVALPVNFRVADGDIVFPAAPEARSPAAGTTVSFEADHIDEAMSEGWSVLITGRARLIDEPAEREKVIGLRDIEPWPGGRREALMRIETATISGRRIRQGSVS